MNMNKLTMLFLPLTAFTSVAFPSQSLANGSDKQSSEKTTRRSLTRASQELHIHNMPVDSAPQNVSDNISEAVGVNIVTTPNSSTKETLPKRPVKLRFKMAVKDVCSNDVSEWSCAGRCGDTVTYPCSCHALCKVYQVCCEDFETECADEASVGGGYLEQYPGIKAKCDASFNSLLISSCPDQVLGVIQRECSSDEAKTMYEFTFTIPITDDTHGMSFKNRICMECWLGQSISSGYWSFDFMYNASSNKDIDFYDPNTLLNIVNKNYNLQLTPALGLDKLRFYCFPENDIIGPSNCSVTADERSVYLCGSMHSYIAIAGRKYRNIYCYLCLKPSLGTPASLNSSQICGKVPYQQGVSGSTKVNIAARAFGRGSQIIVSNNPLGLGNVSNTFAWKEISCTRLTCQALRCQTGVLHTEHACVAGEYIWTYAFKLCVADSNGSQCHYDKTRLLLNSLGIRDLDSLKSVGPFISLLFSPQDNRYRVTLPVPGFDNDLILEVTSTSHPMLLHVQNRALEKILLDLASTPSQHASGSIPPSGLSATVNGMDMATNVTTSIQLMVRPQTNELFIFLLHSIKGNASQKPPTFTRSMTTALRRYLSRVFYFREIQICSYGRPDAFLDLQFFDRNTSCESQAEEIMPKTPEKQWNVSNSGSHVISQLVLLLTCVVLVNG